MKPYVVPLTVLALAGTPLIGCSRAPLQADPPSEAAGELAMGTQIRQDLLTVLGADAEGIRVDAETETEGRVVLSGPVRCKAVAQVATEVAARTAFGVDDRMIVRPSDAPHSAPAARWLREARLEANVMDALLEEMGADAAEIAVEVHDYDVVLLGEVDQPYDRDTALVVASSQLGVADVRDELSVIIEP